MFIKFYPHITLHESQMKNIEIMNPTAHEANVLQTCSHLVSIVFFMLLVGQVRF